MSDEKVFAHYHGAYSSDNQIDYENQEWMSNISDDTRLYELSIPGTHDTMSTGPGGDIVRTQSLTLTTQLNAGIRYLDIRVRAIDNVFTIHHDLVYLNVNFGHVLNEVTSFLKAHPSELILMRVKQEYDPVSWNEFNQILNSYLHNSSYANYFVTPTESNPKLADIRGKILVLRDFSGGSVGIPYGSFHIQDNYHLKTNWDLYNKWLSVKEQLDYANKTNGNQGVINYLSGSGGAFPYFVASGHSSPGTSAPRLATGLTHPGWSGSYPDFPRINWFLGIATIVFEGTNILTHDYIKSNGIDHVGIVVADFPGKDLINIIISQNYLNYKMVEGSHSQIVTRLDSDKAISADINSTDLTIRNKDNNTTVKFILEKASDKGNNVYQIWNAEKTLVIAWNKITKDSSHVFMHRNENKNEHFWRFEQQDDGSYIIANYSDPSYVLDVSESNTQNGNKILVWRRTGNPNQRFFLNDLSNSIDN